MSALQSVSSQLGHYSNRIQIIDGREFLSLLQKHLPDLLAPLASPGKAKTDDPFKSIHDKFRSLIDSNPKEAAVQTFLESHLILFHTFSPRKVLRKAPILNKYETDFAIVTARGDLVLIEIERPGKKILKKDGGRSAYLTQAFDQVHDWLDVVRSHRTSVLRFISDSADIGHIGAVTGVVIMGTDAPYKDEHLRKLKSTNLGDVSFMTFDDLLGGLESLIREIRNVLK